MSSRGGFTLASWSQLEKMVSRVDVVLMVLDSRDPLSTFSRRLESMVERNGRKLILVLNKADLVPRSVAEEWKEYFTEKGYTTVYMAAARHMGTLRLRRTIRRVAPSLPTLVAVAGYPKVGKSSIINGLKGRHSASTSPYPGSPGYTRHFQVYRVDKDIMVVDSPGVIPVEGGELEMVIRGFPPEKLDDPVPPAVKLIERILRYHPDAFKKAYGIAETNPLRILEELAVKRGWFYKATREPLIEEAARTIIRNYHDGRIPFYIRPSQILGGGGALNDKGEGGGGAVT
ncbi:GTPase [Desulfurococcus mucosus]|uniref:Ras superfamily GTP-binding protein YlqF n=1 Tax=Desulfurococcus mucosus (strain ATCC 35584 / DSM 2162 / JCM 9187 / O7/1) TaxID=765177 RepID=E8RA51_DESM0|nr:GTPase [Desulfurococcus mucosus]ADV64329.1 Ras superfamily GTP-binding protein YlqF [Desulfurococcus mucosus DSM 2162]